LWERVEKLLHYSCCVQAIEESILLFPLISVYSKREEPTLEGEVETPQTPMRMVLAEKMLALA
jgi:hypothetical protein